MKKFFILASAAIVALASCAKTEVVYKDAPEEIAFKAVNMPMTKVTEYNSNLGVAAFYHGTANYYFNVTEFTHDGTVWKGGQHWPLGGALDFVAYGPYTGAATSVNVTNTKIEAVEVVEDVDFVYTTLVDNSGAGFTKESVSVPILLKHAKSKINVNVVNGSNETVTKVELLDAIKTANCTITFDDSNPVSWTVPTTGNFDFTSVKTHYVVPGTPTKLRITYNSKEPVQNNLTVDVELADEILYNADNTPYTGTGWMSGYSYTYTVKITSSDILVSATVDDWVEVDNSL